MSQVIEITNLKKQYKGASGLQVNAVRGISFGVMAREIFGILGPNGAGKTTTLEIIEGLKKQTEGTVTVLGLDNLEQSVEIKKQIGVQLQSSEYLQSLRLGELLDLFASFYGRKADRSKLLGLVGLQEKEHSQVKELSGGQKQRFTIATSLVNDPKILFLDEPTTGLDPRARREAWKLIKDINSRGITIVITTHYMEEAEYLCGRVAIMDNGQILAIDKPRNLIANLSHFTQVSFSTDHEFEPSFWKKISAVEKVYSYYPKVILEISALDCLSAIINLLKINHINFSGFTVKTATLEDVYLHLTGKEFEE